jgi:ATPase subunit of ABC transporter with duplicated ATPase domains
MLARALAKPSNLLVLDEPTNDLDLETLDVLEELLGDYQGTVILISHDRDFLDRVVTSVVVPEGNGRWIEYAGGYTDMLAQRGADLTREPAKPAPAVESAKAAAKGSAPANAAKRRLNFNEKHALETNSTPRLPNNSSSSTIPISTATIAGNSIPLRPRFPLHNTNCRPPKTNGWNWKCCAKRSNRHNR